MSPRCRRVLDCGIGAAILAATTANPVAARGQIRTPLTIYSAAPHGRGHLSLVISSELVTKIDLNRVRAWVAAARQHQPGQADQAAKDIGAWPLLTLATTLTDVSELSQMLVFLNLPNHDIAASAPITYRGRSFTTAVLEELLGATPDERRNGNANHLLELGALLHTDLATVVPPGLLPAPATPMPAPDKSVRVADGEVLGLDDTSQHWIFARYLLEAVESQPPRDSVKWNDFVPDASRDDHVRAWYRAAAAWQAYQHRWSEATSTLARGLELFPGDARLAFYSGVMHEIFATPEVQGAAQSAIRSGIGLGIVVDRKELATAEALLRQAAATSPGDAEVRLRLGRVLQLLDRHDEAARELKEAGGLLADPALAYDAILFQGVSQEALGDREGARASFERAEALAPGAQSPLLALSQLARRQGNSAAAQKPLERLFAAGHGESEPDDPWWSYAYSHVRNAGLLMAQMRRTLWSGGVP